MSVLYLWVPSDPVQPTESVVRAMGRALRAQPATRSSEWSVPGLGLGILESDPCGTLPPLDPVRLGDRYYLWMVGEVFYGGQLIDVPGVEESRRPEFRRRLAEALSSGGFERLASLDGEYVLVHWDARERALTVTNDRFGGLPLYWSQSPSGLAIAGGVRGVLMAPGVDPEPDDQAIREAVTFGGYRLGDRTNVKSVKMLPGGSILTNRGESLARRRYWCFRAIPPKKEEPRERLLEEAAELWERAIRARLDGCDRPGQTLSGGLDSRAILAEAAPRTKNWTAVTYGIPRCDDARLAARATRIAPARWRFYDPYGEPQDWLALRASHIQSTDGLVDLGDLLHVQSIVPQVEVMHVHFSGYIGDVVCGPTYADIDRTDDLYRQLPCYGTGLGLGPVPAHERIMGLVEALDGAPPRFAIFEHKFPQSTNRWTAAWRPWIRVRKPFLDYRLFDFWQGLPLSLRREERLYEHFLVRRYPHLFARIPHQKTGVPVLASRWRRGVTRAGRFALRRLRSALGLQSPSRTYRNDRLYCRGEKRSHVEDTILRPASLCCEILGRDRVSDVVRAWFEHDAAPEQIVGALYVFESYHRDLPIHLRAARTS